MRWTLAALVIVVAATAALVARADEPGATLTAKELQTYFAPYVPGVRACYIAYGRGQAAEGALRLELIIRPSGDVFKFGFAAPGVESPWGDRLGSCLRKLVPRWHFPVRSRFTTAVLPFLFQRVFAPGAGPIESCWDPRGCRTA